jgi:hypothetical protein
MARKAERYRVRRVYGNWPVRWDVAVHHYGTSWITLDATMTFRGAKRVLRAHEGYRSTLTASWRVAHDSFMYVYVHE